MLLSQLFLAGLATFASAARAPVTRVLHESRRSLPAGWSVVRRAELDTILPLNIGLVQSNLDNLDAYLMDVAHPESPNYSKHWTAPEVANAFRPSAESIDAVRTWLADDGWISAERIVLSKSGGWVMVNVTVEEAEHLLGTEYYVYEHAEDGRQHLACQGGYHLPEHVSKHVDLVTPTLHFDVKIRRHGSADSSVTKQLGSVGFGASPKMGGPVHTIFTDLEHCDEVITLACLRTLYDFVYTPFAPGRNTIGVVEYTPQSHIPSDFDVFFGNYSKGQIGERPKLVSIDGGSLVPGGDIGESSLDLQYVMGLVGKKQEVLLYQVGDAVLSGSFNNLLDALDGSYCTFKGGDDPIADSFYPDNSPGGYKGPEDCGDKKTAFVISTSYGYQEADLTPAYMQRQCTEYGKLSLTGMTFVYSSGDSGVAGFGNLCLNDEGEQIPGTSGTSFNPTFPGGCPYVTSVGATQVVPGNKVTDRESAVFQRFPSGGGFSNVFPRADFQKGAVTNYLGKFPPGYAQDIFNDSGRAYPDVSANGLNYSVAADGVLRLISGTSASAPTVASILSAINDARLAIGKRPIGWVNPALYSSKFEGAFHDIINGTNPGCGTQGFAARPGWDPVTGLGTLNFAALLPRFLVLP
ncbi:subtilisin-like protein [Polyporus arcularius HHB13444]|uniref:tripeptidyl-peptidase II n=1 Tax=Polyporus arcularius HHB13444 TaxID=1314778 RepID=A0A5C3NWT2_9APHY|nr:subtilisin-like protein [Polyporus arcularius HHB13444]